MSSSTAARTERVRVTPPHRPGPAGRDAPAVWLASIEARLPNIERAIIARIRGEIPEYRDDPGGAITAEVRRAVRRSLRAFATGSGDDLAPADAEVLRRLGRIEAESGRTASALQASFRIASDAVVQEILVWERAKAVPAEVVAAVSGMAARFIDSLARLANEGYQQGAAARSRRDEQSWLVGVLVRRGGATLATIGPVAARIGWPVPATCAVAVAAWHDRADAGEVPEAVVLRQVAEEVFGGPVLTGTAGGRLLVLAGEPPAVDRIREQLLLRAPGLSLVLGPRVPLGEAGVSARLARRAADLPAARVLRGGELLACGDLLLELAVDAGADAVDAMVALRLGPLLALPAAKRYRLASLLSAWLEHGGLKGDAPGVLDASRQTLSYRLQRLQLMLGDSLHDRDARVEMTLALRQVLPSWRAAAEARPTTRKGPERTRP